MAEFMFYANMADSIEESFPPEQRAEAYMALCRYGVFGELPDNPAYRIMCLMARPSVERNKGGAPKGNQNAKKINHETTENNPKTTSNQPKTTETTENNVETTENKKQPLLKQEAGSKKQETGNLKQEVLPPTTLPPKGDKVVKRRFVKPTVEEVREYCLERGNGVDASAFVNFYEAKGWVVGRSPMKDWKAAVRTWEGKRGGQGGAASTPEPVESGLFGDEVGRPDWRARARAIGIEV